MCPEAPPQRRLQALDIRRYHKGQFYVYYGDPDIGIFMSKTKNPAGPWGPLTLVREAKGWIDTCPFWDDDGKAYLVHAFANSRAGIKSKLAINRMSPDGTKLLDDGQIVFDGTANHPTMEGPKLYKRNGYYYIFTPAGGVTKGWQTVLRSKNIFGPYEDRIVMDQGKYTHQRPAPGRLGGYADRRILVYSFSGPWRLRAHYAFATDDLE